MFDWVLYAPLEALCYLHQKRTNCPKNMQQETEKALFIIPLLNF